MTRITRIATLFIATLLAIPLLGTAAEGRADRCVLQGAQSAPQIHSITFSGTSTLQPDLARYRNDCRHSVDVTLNLLALEGNTDEFAVELALTDPTGIVAVAALGGDAGPGPAASGTVTMQPHDELVLDAKFTTGFGAQAGRVGWSLDV